MKNNMQNRLGRGIDCAGIAFVLWLTAASSAWAQAPVIPPGAGTTASPYRISQLGHLAWMGATVGSSSGKHYALQNNLDASVTAGWNGGAGFAPIGPHGMPFMGSFNGNGKVISNLRINRSGQDDVGFFGHVGRSGIVKDVGLAGGIVTGNMNVGGLVGFNEGGVSGCHTTGTVAGDYTVGGLAGWNGGTVSVCYATGTVTGRSTVGGLVGDNYSYGRVSGSYAASSVTGDGAVGGLVGLNYSHGTVSGCHATGPVKGNDFQAGGLVGDNYYGTVSGCYATGPVNGNTDVGGFVGYNFSGSVSECHAMGSVNGKTNVGGFVGTSFGSVSGCYAKGAATGVSDVGGLVGDNAMGGTVSQCYAKGLVTGTANVGGLVGDNVADDQVGFSYWDMQTSGQAISAGGTGKTTAQMKRQATYTVWDFANVWRITEDATYPTLRLYPERMILSVTPASRSVGFAAGATSFSVANSGGGMMSYVASESVSWLGIFSGGATGGNSGTIHIAFTANPGTTTRTGTITVTAAGAIGSPHSVKVVQAGKPSITLTPFSRVHSAAAASGQTFSVAAGVSWTATANQPWIAIAGGGTGSGNGTVAYNVLANGGTVRLGTITVSGGGISRTFTVNQWSASTTPGVSAEGDFDGDARADVAVFNPATGNWALSFSTGPGWTLPWGWSATVPVPADYDGDGLLDLAVYHSATGNWHIQEGGTGQNRTIQLGWSATVPVPGDYDGDGKADLAVFHQAAGRWYFLCTTAGRYSVPWGWSTTIPVPADYDGDGATDVAVYHPASGLWQILKSSTGGSIQKQWGWSTALPVPADYDGDGKADLAVFHRATGTWRISYSGGGSLTKQFGWSTVIPVAADYDGDGAADLAVYHPATGNWQILKSTTGGTLVKNWGGRGAIPVLLYPMIHSWFCLP